MNYCILNTSKLEETINIGKYLGIENSSLFRTNDWATNNLVPWIFMVNNKKEFNQWLLTDIWGKNEAIFFLLEISLESILKHFRRFLTVQDENGKQMYFRFYDPRVLRIFLPTCDLQQLKEFFGPVEKFICEDEDSAFALVFSFNGKELITERVIAEKIFLTATETPSPEVLISKDNSGSKDDTTEKANKPKRRFFFDSE